MNRLFMYLVGIGVLILFMIVGWEILQIATGLKSSVNQAVIEMPRDKLFTESAEKFLKEKKTINSGLL